MFKLTAAAYDDLKNIATYTLNTWGRAQRNVYLQMIDSAFKELDLSPKIGVNVDFIRSGYFKFVVGRHLIFYQIISDKEIIIIRILHQSMDIEIEKFRV